MSRSRQGGERHPSSPCGDKPCTFFGCNGGESFAWSSHLSDRSVPQGARSVSSSASKLGSRRGQSSAAAESGGGSGARRGPAAMQDPEPRERLRSPSCRESDVHSGVPAHRSYVAEYRWVAFRPHISSRHALQKQRQTGVNGGLAGRVSRSNPRGAAGEAASESLAEAAKGLHDSRNPGWRHERHSAVVFLESGWRSRVSLGVSSEDLACQGREHTKGSHR